MFGGKPFQFFVKLGRFGFGVPKRLEHGNDFVLVRIRGRIAQRFDKIRANTVAFFSVPDLVAVTMVRLGFCSAAVTPPLALVISITACCAGILSSKDPVPNRPDRDPEC